MNNVNKINSLDIDCWDLAALRRQAETSRREALNTSQFSVRAALGSMFSRSLQRSGAKLAS